MTDVATEMNAILGKLAPVVLPPAEYPPSAIVRDTPREELLDRIRNNASKIDMTLTDDHWDVINFVLDFYVHCCEADDPGYVSQQVYWKYVDCSYDENCENPLDQIDEKDCPYGKLSATEATNGYRVYRILLKAFADKGGKKHLYRLFPLGPLFTIHLLAQLPRLRHDVDPHFGTAY
ncbi:MAG TPA: hypothetical protein ENK26_11370 [Gammaproteobacteria bacterium]|nr:hypothetical protein [Gammaproteobacteria bacterium]